MSDDLTYAAAGALLERLRDAWARFDGDAWTDLFTDDATFTPDPFGEPLVGRNALRAYLVEAAEHRGQLDATIERHWVVPPTILAAWHASHVDRPSAERVRLAGFMTLEVADGRIARLRAWSVRRGTPAGYGSKGDRGGW